MFFRYTIFVIAFLHCFSASSQSYSFKTNYLGMEDGLSFRHVNAITQDNDGFVWIGTRTGLNKFDGYRFISYTEEGQSSNAIINNNIHDLEIGPKGNIWVATETGISIINSRTDEVMSIKSSQVFGDDSEVSSISNIVITPYSKRVFIQGHTLNALEHYYTTVEYKDGQFIPVSVEIKDKKWDVIRYVFEDANRELWINPNNEMLFVKVNDDFETKEVVELPESLFDLYLSDSKFHINFETSKAIPYRRKHDFTQDISKSSLEIFLSFCDGEKVVNALWNVQKNTFKELALRKPKRINSSLRFNVTTDGQIWRQYDQEVGAFIKGKDYIIGSDYGLPEISLITEFYKSDDGTVWVGTDFGVYRILQVKNPFEFHFSSTPDHNGIGNSLRSISQYSNNEILVSTVGNGVWQYNPISGKAEQLIKKNVKSALKAHHILPFGIYHADKTIWMANWFDHGILKYNTITKELTHLTCPENERGYGRCLEKKSDSELWLGTDLGLNLLNIENDRITQVHTNKDDKTLETLNITFLKQDREGLLWIGSQNSGVFTLDKESNFSSVIDKSNGLSSDAILSIQTGTDYVWIGTSNGLNRWNVNTKELTLFTTDNGLPDNTVYEILDEGDVLWLSTNRGLCRFDKRDNGTTNYGSKMNFPNTEFNNMSSLKYNDSTLIFGSLNGYVQINTAVKNEDTKNFGVVLSRFEKFDGIKNKIQEIRIDLSKGIDISPGDKFFNFEFATTDLFSNTFKRFAYRLEGYDEVWNELGFENKIRFNSLPVGSYNLKVKTTRRDGKWSSSVLTIPIRIHQVFYMTWWFFVLMAITFMLIVFLIYKYRLNQLKKLEKIRLQIASDLHDDVGSILTQISIRTELVTEGIFDEKERGEELIKIAQSTRTAVDTMGDIVWSIDSRKDGFNDLIDRMKEYASKTLTPLDIQCWFEIPEDLSLYTLSLEKRQNIYLIFKESVNNITKHSNASEFKVIIGVHRGKFLMQLKDNGTLKPSKEDYQGQGLMNMKMRAERIGGDVSITTTDGFEISIKV
ncbi:MAG: hypothetical protein COA32_10805 [Fluviicola sp.]|nr:MAG: hypothetical protein COA32_10805 [Fluviicola sp.]